MNGVLETFRGDLLAGRVALVVGGTSGIGAAIGNALAAVGAVVTMTGATRAEVDCARVAADFAARDAVTLDLRDEAALRRIIDDPRLDVLVNCAGIIRRAADHDVRIFEEVLAVNLTGTMRCCALARDKLRMGPGKPAGAIVNAASMTAVRSCRATVRARVAWCSSRSRLRWLMQAMAFA